MTDTPQDSVVIHRTFDAPADLVWKMWADAEHFKAWYGPMGASIPVANLDLQIGGKRLVCMAMETPNGPMQMWFTGEFIEIQPNERLVYTESMSDADGNIMTPEQMGMPPGSPETTQVVVELSAIDNGTNMIMTHVGVPAGSPGEGGWNMALDKLATYVTTIDS